MGFLSTLRWNEFECIGFQIRAMGGMDMGWEPTLSSLPPWGRKGRNGVVNKGLGRRSQGITGYLGREGRITTGSRGQRDIIGHPSSPDSYDVPFILLENEIEARFMNTRRPK
jgi:hypothetical protein